MRAPGPEYCVLPGAGSAGLSWAPALEELGGGTLLAVPDEPTVPAMAAVLGPALERLSEPPVLVGASLGAMVALELARAVPVRGLVLIAAGFGIDVSDSLLQWIECNPPGLLEKVARASVAANAEQDVVDLVTRDFESRGQPVLLAHLRALGTYTPEPLASPPPTLVIWGEQDRSVPLADHAELALRCHGAVAPVAGAGHMPFLEQPARTAELINAAQHLIPDDEEIPDGERIDVPDLG